MVIKEIPPLSPLSPLHPRLGGYIEESAQAGGFGDQGIAGGDPLGANSCIFKHLHHGRAFLTGGLQGLGRDGGGNRRPELAGHQAGIDKRLLSG